jgi:hypothetical protein
VRRSVITFDESPLLDGLHRKILALPVESFALISLVDFLTKVIFLRSPATVARGLVCR